MHFAPFKTKRDEQNRRKEQPTNKANGDQTSLGHLKGAKTVARYPRACKRYGKDRSGGTPKLFGRTVGVRAVQNSGQRNR